jgi:ribonuclease D
MKSFSYFPSQGLYQWRDGIARAEDESTGYILPNKILTEIGIVFANFCTSLTCMS